MNVYFQGATVVPCDEPGRIIEAGIHVVDGRIQALDPPGVTPPPDAHLIDVGGRWIIPGLIQVHTHLVQALFRGMADDLALMDWLSGRIWPLEAAHDSDSTYWSARLGLTEMLCSGTTAILDMATVHHTGQVFQAAQEAGIRASIGKAQMDRDNASGLSEPTDRSLQSACDLRDEWHGRDRLRYAFAPRFVPSCTEDLLTRTRDLARERGCLLHTHASENLDEVALVRELTGRDNVRYLDDIGFTGPDVVLAHCIHVSEQEVQLLASSGTTVAHCPSSNLKLASGIAPIPELLHRGVRCGLGTDGAPCNNR
ncbi:MAG: amidohydrolase family protein, partial [Myxococcota bacterium]|nr:amidohydrolase family protein [Myxococcota bacterium]